ncbi:mRNA splicing protein [Vanrija albida]|uniref:Pre-mRNA-splicing factor SLU7 n=1 Tax=Vanrija albida TaxID=181172 RepID=A0ABR3QE96_9TREE
MLRLPAETSDKLSKSSYRAQRELEAARKAGTAAPAVDADGKAINPHIPDYISKAPWYADLGDGPSLSHQRVKEKKKDGIDEWYDRGATAGPAATKFRKGACENCGAMTHKRKDCVERPRKRGAKFTGKDIRADEVLQSVSREYDAKRDRWNGYDPAQYKNVVDDYEAAEEARRKFREEEIDAQTSTDMAAVKKIAKAKQPDDDEFGSSDEDEEDEDKYAEAADQVGQKLDTKTRITVRNLRIREDTAKYLLNLDPESAYYDPKTRSMRDAPEVGVLPEDMKFAGDNYSRFSGEATNMQKLQLFAWQSAARGHNVNVHSNPTAGELLHREFQEKKEVLKDTGRQSVLEKYGGEEHLERLPEELLGGQTERYIEYSRTGQVIKGQEQAKVRSKYAEDVYVNNHTSVWGSWYDRDSSRWGYWCCHSIISGSYCTGEAGKVANHASSAGQLLAADEEPEEQAEPKSLAEMHREKLEKNKREADEKSSERSRKGKNKESATPWGETDQPDLDKQRLKRAIDEEKKRKAMDEDEAWQHTKKSKTDVTEEDMEAYRLSKQAYDDPMANYKDPEED